jgi:hypothetical protein
VSLNLPPLPPRTEYAVVADTPRTRLAPSVLICRDMPDEHWREVARGSLENLARIARELNKAVQP